MKWQMRKPTVESGEGKASIIGGQQARLSCASREDEARHAEGLVRVKSRLARQRPLIGADDERVANECDAMPRF
jgi:hypothetical protein